MSSKSLSYGVATIALLLSNALLAQAPPTVIITFADPAAAVPLDLWSSLAAGLLIAAAAYAYFRHRGVVRFGRLSAWLAVIAAAVGTVIGASRLDVIATAQAIAQPPLLLTSSPASIALVASSQLIEAQNATGRTIKILAVTLINPLPNQFIELIEGNNCVPGLVLAAGNSCFVQVQQLS